jgi:triphosphatase
VKPKPFSKFAMARSSARLERVITAFARAAKRPKAPDSAHDLRVAIRRFQQCLEMFDGLFAAKRAEKLRKRLRKLMDLCGAKRDYDVGLEVLAQAGLPPHYSVMTKFRQRQVSGSRALARRLAKKRSREEGDRWRKQLRMAKRPGGAWNWEAGVAENATAALPHLAGEFFAEGDLALLSYGDHKALHKFRLHTKSFRYSLELFASRYGSGGKSFLRALRQLQDRIGAINDCVVVLRLPEMDAVAMHAVRRLLVTHERSFGQFWRETFSPQRRDEWMRFLELPRSKKGSAGSRRSNERYARVSR